MRYFLNITSKASFISKFEIYDSKNNILYNGYSMIGANKISIKYNTNSMIPISDKQAKTFLKLTFNDLIIKHLNIFLIENNLSEWII